MLDIRTRVASLALLAAVVSSPATAQNPVVAFPNNYKLILDNPDVAVLRVHYGPLETVGVHDHSAFATVYVYLNDSGAVLFRHEEAKPFDLARPPTHAGAFRVSPGRMERHSVQNLSKLPSDFVRVELKHLPIHSLPEEFRGPAPTPPLVPGVAVEYNNPRLRVERIVCTPAMPCIVSAEAEPSVLVAVSAAPLTLTGLQQTLTMDRPVAWLPARASSSVMLPSGTSGQLLRIVLPQN